MTQVPTGAERVRWDLSPLFQSINDPAIDEALVSWTAAAKAFNANYKGKLADTLGQALRDFADLLAMMKPVTAYLHLRKSINTADDTVKAKMAAIGTNSSAVAAEYLAFFGLELVNLEDAVISRHVEQDAYVRKHLPWLEYQREAKSHVLSEPVEAALIKRSQFGAYSWAGFYDEVEADLRFAWKGEQLTLTEILNVVSDDLDVATRAAAQKVINDELAGRFVKFSAQALYMTAGSDEVERGERRFRHPMESRNKSSQLPDDVVDALHAAVNITASTLAQRYYRLKAGILGLPRLAWSDRNAPMPFTANTVMSWEAAWGIVVEAFSGFSPMLSTLVRRMRAEGWIDAPSMTDRQSGAYSYTVLLPSGKVVAYTFLNFLGSPRDVMTIAHEVGHGVHGILSAEAQGLLMYQAPIALCETASVFGEMIAFDHLRIELLKNGDKKALLALLMDKLDDIINTVVRQIQISNFERRIHGWNPESNSWDPVTRRSAEDCDALWLETLTEMFGNDGDILSFENASHLWSYIDHLHNPFYVYGYAFGELLTQSLYAARPRLGEAFEPLYLEMLQAGGTKNAKDLVAPFGLDPTNASFWAEGIEFSMGKMIAEAESLARELALVA